MPLDLKKVITQFGNLEKQEAKEQNQNRLEATYRLFENAAKNEKALFTKIAETQSSQKAGFFFALPAECEKIDLLTECEENFSLPHVTVATDGSQINPSAHEFIGASLINIGLVGIPYFETSVPVLLSSEPKIYSSTEDIISSNLTQNIQEEDLIAYERTLREIEELVKLAKKYAENKLPVVAMLDGTLIHWHIEKFNDVFIKQFMQRFTNAIGELKSLNIPVASFLSNSRSNDLINMLRIFNCPYESVDCKKHCSGLDSKKYPCNPLPDYKPVMDRKLMEKLFSAKTSKEGTRSVLFRSNSKILNYYPDDMKIFFFYMDTGTEIGRIELPAYVVNDKKLLNLTHNAIALQCKAGFGYPITLSEAHLQAVVNRNDRKIFYDLIKEYILTKHGSSLKLSNKELKKRISFV